MDPQPTLDIISTKNSLIQILSQGDIWSSIVLIVLLFMSIASWSIIIRKWISFSSTSKASDQFVKGIQPGDKIEAIHVRSKSFKSAYTALMLQSVIKEIGPVFSNKRLLLERYIENSIERIMEKSILTYKAVSEKELNWLATISASAPFIGLLGTVLGIINSFYSIASKGASSIAVVAPGLSAALVATAAGLFTAIPALIAYNIFRNRAKRINDDLVKFGLEIFPLILSHVLKTKQKSALRASTKQDGSLK